MNSIQSPEGPAPPGLAIVGMACLFPNAGGLKEYWRLLRLGEDGITQIPSTHWSPDDYFDPDPKAPDRTHCRRGGFLSPVPFDPTEFGIPPSTLEAIDTAQLLSLVVAKEALRDAGYGPDRDFDRTRAGVILGVTGTLELVIPLGARLGHPIWRRAMSAAGVDPKVAEEVSRRISAEYVEWQENSFPGLLGNVVAGRIANRLNLKGTNCVVDAACASSLSAMHLASLELEAGRSDLVVTGGVDAFNDIFMFMCFSKTQALSESGDCRPFSTEADGTVLGEGVGMVVLKRLADARRDGDRIYAVLRGIGTSSDGRSQSIYSPRSEGQALALRNACRVSGVGPETIGLVEAHGTGTRVGDAAEFEALRSVYGEARTAGNGRIAGGAGPDGAWCALGSVKSQIGHTKAAAGAAGLIKAILALHHKVIPPTIKIGEPNPKLGIESSPFYLNTEPRPWFASNGNPRRAGVSSFGFGGSNFHAVLEESGAEKAEPAWDTSVEILALVAETREDLAARLSALLAEAREGLSWEEFARRADVSRREACPSGPFSAAGETGREAPAIVAERGRTPNPEPRTQNPPAHRLAVVAERGADLVKILSSALDTLQAQNPEPRTQSPPPRTQNPEPRTQNFFTGSGPSSGKLAFLFPGQGSQYAGMARDLVCLFPESFRAVAEAADSGPGPEPLHELLYPAPTFDPKVRAEREARLLPTDAAQPALAAASLAFLRALERFGLRPDLLAGHSFGELPALRAAGRLRDDGELFRLAALRGRLMAGGDRRRTTEDRPPTTDDGRGTTDERPPTTDDRGAVDRGTMLAVLAPLAEIDRLISEEGLDVVLANRNAPDQGVLSGTSAAVAAARQACERRGFKVRPLKVAAAFHSRFMAEAGRRFREALEEAAFPPGALPVFANATGKGYPEDPAGARKALGDQIENPVRFTDVVEGLHEAGARTFVEVGPGTVLTGLCGRILSGRPHEAIALDASSGRKSGILDLARALARLWALGHVVDLSRWEIPKPEGRKPQMVVPLAGANYRAPKRIPDFRSRISAQPQGEISDFGSRISAQPEEPPLLPNPKSEIPNPPPPIRNPKSEIRNVASVLSAVQEGMRAMQALQQQTAAAHQKFLEGQELAHRTLQQVLRSQGALLEEISDFGSRISAQPEEISEPGSRIPAQGEEEAPASRANVPAAFSEKPLLEPPVLPNPRSEIPNPRSEIAKLRSVVHEITGFPEEAIHLDLDLEEDLGLDVVGRADLLSRLRRLFPDLPELPPARADGFARLGEVLEFILTEGKEIPDLGSRISAQREEISDFGSRISAPPEPPLSPTPQTEIRNPKSEIGRVLLDVVAELTGYPREMLELDMDLEADLGIDSIKRVEILASVQQRAPGARAVDSAYMGTLRTLRQIIAYMGEGAGEGENGRPTIDDRRPRAEDDRRPTTDDRRPAQERPRDGEERPAAARAPVVEAAAVRTGGPLNRRVLLAVDLPEAAEGRIRIAPGRAIAILDDGAGLAKALRARLAALGHPSFVIGLDGARIEGDDAPLGGLVLVSPVSKDTSDFGSRISAQHQEEISDFGFRISDLGVGRGEGSMKGLSEKAAETSARLGAPSRRAEIQNPKSQIPSGRAEIRNPKSEISPSDLFLKRAFLLTQKIAPDLKEAAREGGAVFVTVARLDGSFGLAGGGFDPVMGGLAGLAKTAAQEWPEVQCRALDVAGTWRDDRAIAKAVVREFSAGGPIEVGLSAGSRRSLKAEPRLIEAGEMDLGPGDVVLLTGGARGVTAEAAVELARAFRPTLVLIGRSPPPSVEPDWARGVSDPAALKRRVLERGLGERKKTSPAEVEAEYRRILANREIAETLSRIEANGSRVLYLSADVREPREVREAVERARAEGPIRGLVHGAGVIEDRRIEEKSAEAFDKVFDTKVRGLRNLLAAVEGEELRFAAFFSSVSGRFGRTGQADYAMANEVLNKTAHLLAAARPSCRVVSINWGPWEGGMVTPELGREFARLGVETIPLAEGARAFVEELRAQGPSGREVVLGGSFPEAAPAPSRRPTGRARPSASRGLSVAFERVLDLDGHPFLGSHVLGGKPVLPLAVMMEWLGHGALHANPGLSLHGFDELRVLRGVVLSDGPRRLRICSSRARRKNGLYEVDVELRGEGEGGEAAHARATAILADALPRPPEAGPTAHLRNGPYGRSAENIYREILFHGPHFYGIERVEGLSENGMLARLRHAPSPAEWMREPVRTSWIGDPRIVDGCLQLGLVFSAEAMGSPSLPSFGARYRQYQGPFPRENVTASLEVRGRGPGRLVGDLTVVDDRGAVVAQILGCEWTVDASLREAFGKAGAAVRIGETTDATDAHRLIDR